MANLFDKEINLDKRINQAIDLLRENGYLVTGPVLHTTSVKNINQLVTYFYQSMAKYNPSRILNCTSGSKDRKMASNFLKSREATGISRKRAFLECCVIIEALFKYERNLNLESPVLNMSVLGQDKMGWVTEKLISILERRDRQFLIEEDINFFESLYYDQHQDSEETVLKQAETFLNEVLDKNGKKKDND